MEVAAPAVPRRARLSDQQQQGVHPLAIPVTREVPDAVLRPVGPDIVAVDDQDRIAAQLRQRLDHPAAGFEQLLPFVGHRSEEHTSELQSLMRISYAVFCLKKKNKNNKKNNKYQPLQ